MSGSMFTMFRGQGATLVRALCQVALDRNSDAYEEIRPPTVVLTDTMVSTGHLPKFIDDAYHLERDDLWAIPTAEVPLTSFARDEILDEADLPLRLMAYTPCFRREAGSAGRDTRGLLRVHEFDKVELLAYATPAQAAEVHAEILQRALGLIADLGLTYRILDLCTGDVGNSAARTFDIEVYAPGVDMWLEVSSVSWFSDYQARRANVRYRADGREEARGRAHPQRIGARGAPGMGRRGRDPSAGRRLDPPARGAASVHARRDHHLGMSDDDRPVWRPGRISGYVVLGYVFVWATAIAILGSDRRAYSTRGAVERQRRSARGLRRRDLRLATARGRRHRSSAAELEPGAVARARPGSSRARWAFRRLPFSCGRSSRVASDARAAARVGWGA